MIRRFRTRLARTIDGIGYWGFWRWLAIAVDPGFGQDRRDRMPVKWEAPYLPDSFRGRLRHTPSVLWGEFRLMLNLQPWPPALWTGITTAGEYLFRGPPVRRPLPWLPFERYVRRERAIMDAASDANAIRGTAAE